MVLVCAAWGFNFTAGATAMEGFPPLLFMVLRFAGVVLLTLSFLHRPPAGQWPRLIAVALCMGGLHFTFLFWALGVSEDVTSIAVVQIMYIPIAVLLALFLLKERTGWRTLAATATAFAGVVVIAFDPLVLRQPLALTLILLSAFSQALASVLMRGLSGLTPMSFQGWSAIICLPVMLIGTLMFEENQWHAISNATPWQWAALAYTTVIASLVGHGLFYLLVQRHPVPLVMPYMLMMTPMAGLFGILVWGDTPGPKLWIGGTIILASILFITLRGRAKASSTLRALEH